MAEKLTNITDPKYHCSMGACPAVYKDRTPEHMRCDVSVSCPAILDDDSGNFVFIGEKLDPLPEELAGKVSDASVWPKLSPAWRETPMRNNISILRNFISSYGFDTKLYVEVNIAQQKTLRPFGRGCYPVSCFA